MWATISGHSVVVHVQQIIKGIRENYIFYTQKRRERTQNTCEINKFFFYNFFIYEFLIYQFVHRQCYS